MLRKITELPQHVLGIRASGKITREDIGNVLSPALNELTNRTGQLSYLLALDTKVQNFTAGAWWTDMMAGLKHYADWHRIAVVTDQKPVELFTDLFEMGVPGQSKGFALDQLTKAIKWVAQKNHRLVTPKTHALIDYILVGTLVTIPSLLKMNKKARLIYAIEAMLLLPYVALTKQPLAVKGIIPFKTHGRIDPFNVVQFAFQSLLKPFRKSKKELAFNLAFTAIAGLTVLLTDFDHDK